MLTPPCFHYFNKKQLSSISVRFHGGQNTSKNKSALNPLYSGRLSIVIHCVCWTSPFVIFGVLDLLFRIPFLWTILLANSVDPDQMPHYMASDLGLNCFTYDPFTGFQKSMG